MWIEIRDEDHWKELRSKNVGGSDIGSLFGCGYLTLFELWHQKNGTLEPEDFSDNERVMCGNLLEDAIAQMVANRGYKIENRKSYVTSDDTPGMGCTPDRLIFKEGDETPGLLQIKNTDSLEFRRWEDGEPPLKFQLQLQHELACAEYSWGVLGVLVGGNKLMTYEFERHEAAISNIKAAVMDFWDSVREGREPKISDGDDYEAATKVYAAFDSLIDLSGDNEIPALCAEAKEAAEIRLAAEKREKAAKAQLLQKLAGASTARCNQIVIENKTIHRKGYEVAASSYQRLSIKT